MQGETGGERRGKQGQRGLVWAAGSGRNWRPKAVMRRGEAAMCSGEAAMLEKVMSERQVLAWTGAAWRGAEFRGGNKDGGSSQPWGAANGEPAPTG